MQMLIGFERQALDRANVKGTSVESKGSGYTPNAQSQLSIQNRFIESICSSFISEKHIDTQLNVHLTTT